MNKVALITGASNGIGLELAKLFAADKIDVLLVARSESKMQALAESLRAAHGTKVWVLAIDLSEPASAKEVKAYCDQQQLQIEYLVNNAGFGDFGLFAECDWNKQLEMINLNITTLTWLTRLFLPAMIQRHSGRILNVASTAAFQPGPLMSVYFATKAFVLSFSEAISNELEGTGVTVTVLCPGATESGFQKAAALEESKMVKDRKLPGSAEVAAFGYDAMKKGKVVVIHGFMNALMATSIRFSPRPLVRKIVRRIQEKG
jgi:short-subunit dehydrogenase